MIDLKCRTAHAGSCTQHTPVVLVAKDVEALGGTLAQRLQPLTTCLVAVLNLRAEAWV
jgi:hypothetical protein